MKDDLAIALDVLEHARRAREYAAGHTLETFLTTRGVQDSTFWCFQVMGEAAKRLSAEFCEQHPEVDWSGIARFRDRLIHGYHRIDYELCWSIIHEQLPRTVSALEKIVPPPKS